MRRTRSLSVVLYRASGKGGGACVQVLHGRWRIVSHRSVGIVKRGSGYVCGRGGREGVGVRSQSTLSSYRGGFRSGISFVLQGCFGPLGPAMPVADNTSCSSTHTYSRMCIEARAAAASPQAQPRALARGDVIPKTLAYHVWPQDVAQSAWTRLEQSSRQPRHTLPHLCQRPHTHEAGKDVPSPRGERHALVPQPAKV